MYIEETAGSTFERGLDDPCLVMGISCSLRHGKITASQGLAGASSYVPGSTPIRLSVCLGGGGGVRIETLLKLPPGPKVGSGETGI